MDFTFFSSEFPWYFFPLKTCIKYIMVRSCQRLVLRSICSISGYIAMKVNYLAKKGIKIWRLNMCLEKIPYGWVRKVF